MEPKFHQDSAAWVFFVHASFSISLALMLIGIYVLPVSIWIKGYLAMGLFFVISSTIILSKTMRDKHEAGKLLHKIEAAKTEKLLTDFDLRA